MNWLVNAIGILERANALTCSLAKLIATVFMGAVLAIMLLSVVFRYLLNDSLTWSEDVILMMSIWMTFAIAPIAYRYGLNVALETVSGRLTGRAARILDLLVHVMVIILLYYLLRECVGLVERGWKIRANTVPIQMGVVYLVLPISFLAMMLVGIELLLRSIVGLISPDEPSADMPTLDLERVGEG